MATRLDALRKNGPIIKDFMDSVFLRNRSDDWSRDDVMGFPYKKSDLVYICISTTARAISQIPIKVYKQIGEDEYKPLPKTDPWQVLFDRPNFLMDRYSFVESTVGHLMLDGDVFHVPFPPGSSKPSSIWVVKKKFMRPLRDRATNQLIGWDYNIKGQIYDGFGGSTLSEGGIPLDVNEVCHIYFWNPYDPIMGLAPSEAGKLNIMIDYKASNYTSNFFDDGAVPGGMLQTDRTLTDKQFNRILEQFESKHGGYKKAHRMALLENGLKYTQSGLSQKDMEFPKLRELSARRVFQIYGMKEAVISETKNVNYATSREQRKEWWESTNLPMMRMTCSALNFTLFPNSDLLCQFDTTKIEALREALSDKVETGYKLWMMGFTAEEVNNRLDFGFRSKPWRKTWYMPVNLVPVEDYAPPSELPPTLPPANPPLELPPPPPRRSYVEGYPSKLLPSNVKESSHGEAIWNGVIRQLAPIEELFSKKVTRVFYNMRKRTLELLYSKKFLEDIQKDLNDVDKELFLEEYKILERAIYPFYVQTLTLGAEMITQETGTSVAFSVTDPEAIYFLMNKKLEIQRVIQTVKNQIQVVLVESFERGDSLDQVAERIRGIFNIADGRARTIGRTEIMGTANKGRYLAMNHSGFGEKEWFTALDERERADHRVMFGMRIKMGDVWTMPDGSFLRHPGDNRGAASQIIGCRCLEIVVPNK